MDREDYKKEIQNNIEEDFREVIYQTPECTEEMAESSQENSVNSYSWNDEYFKTEKFEYADNTNSNIKKKKNSGTFRKVMAVFCIAALCFVSGYAGSYLNKDNTGNDSLVSSTDQASDSPSETQGTIKVNQTATTSSTEDGTEYTIEQIAEMTANSVVEITTETVSKGSVFQQYVTEGAGSGVIITSDGYIITNNHVIEDASTIKVKLKDDDTEYTATLVGTDAKTDIAVIKIDKTGLQAAIFGDSDSLKVGETAVAVGNPLGSLGGTVTNGIISALDREIEIEGETMNLLQTNAAINPGNSGGGLFNGKGELIGIVNAKSSGTDIEGLGFAIPSNVAKEIAEDLMNYGYVKGRVDLGMTLINITDTQTAMMYRVQRLGVYILEVNSSGSAQNAGLQSGDCILSADGTDIESYSQFTKIIDSHSIGDTINIAVYRSKQEVSINYTLQEYNPNI